MTSSVWKVLVEAGDKVEQGQTLVILEAMKMEIRKSGFRIISTRDRHHRPKPDDPVFLPSFIFHCDCGSDPSGRDDGRLDRRQGRRQAG
jgi:hypothetical protein